MSQNFSVNGKEYFQSNVLATSLGYTSDYIGKLAREEKVLGTLIGRQWFIEPESLKAYLHKARIQKEIISEELSMERKFERGIHQKKQNTVLHTDPKHTAPVALAQSIAIVLCGIFVGGLGWIGTAEGVRTGDLAQGSVEAVSFIASSFSVVWTEGNFEVDPETFVAASTESAAFNSWSQKQAVDEVFAVLPVFPERALNFTGTTSSALTLSQGIPMEFSDEVRIVVGEDGSTLIEPVFKNKATGTVQFVLLPLNSREN